MLDPGAPLVIAAQAVQVHRLRPVRAKVRREARGCQAHQVGPGFRRARVVSPQLPKGLGGATQAIVASFFGELRQAFGVTGKVGSGGVGHVPSQGMPASSDAGWLG